jgi:hypothetical protein
VDIMFASTYDLLFISGIESSEQQRSVYTLGNYFITIFVFISIFTFSDDFTFSY